MTKRPKLTSSYVLSFALSLIGLACAQVGKDNPTGTGKGGTSGSTTGAGGSSATGSGGRQNTTTGAGGDFSADGGEQCGLQYFDLVRRPAEIMVVLDRSASMKDNLSDQTPTGPTDPTKWSQVIPALTEVIRGAAGSDISWGLKTFPEDGSDCAATTVTTKIDVMISPGNANTVASAIEAVTPEGNGTPTGPAVAVATDYMSMRMNPNRKYLLLATDGQPSCYRNGSSLGSGGDQSRVDAVAAVTTAAQASLHTFVVGVATSKTNDVTTLNQLAMAGLEPAGDANPLATKFYLASTKAMLTDALNKIVGVASTCVFPLNPPPPVPDKIAVKVNGVKAPLDTTHANGWDYLTPDHTSLEVFGSWCDMVKNISADMVEIIFGCKDIPIP